jgi:hypothetical protein
MKTAKFFEYGEVSYVSLDDTTRQAAIRVCIPCCLMQTITPALLGAGHIDRYELKNPIAAWMPDLNTGHYKPEVMDQFPNMIREISSTVKEKLEETLKLFQELSQTVVSPSDFIPILPMGTYVQFRLRCCVDDMAKVLLNLENTPIAGVAEFRFALAEVLADILDRL